MFIYQPLLFSLTLEMLFHPCLQSLNKMGGGKKIQDPRGESNPSHETPSCAFKDTCTKRGKQIGAERCGTRRQRLGFQTLLSIEINGLLLALSRGFSASLYYLQLFACPKGAGFRHRARPIKTVKRDIRRLFSAQNQS